MNKTFISMGSIYDLVKQENNIAIYSLRYPENPDMIIGYDVFKIESTRKLPRDEDYGRCAWSFTTKIAAEKKMNDLLSQEKSNA